MSDQETPEYDVIELVDAEGNDVAFAVLAVVEVEGTDYALMSPVEQMEGDGPQQDIYVFTYEHDEDEGVENFGPVEDESIVAKVEAMAAPLFEYYEE